MSNQVERKEFKFNQSGEAKTIVRDGREYGIIEGYLATWDIDRGDDKFTPGAFKDSIDELKINGEDIVFLFFHDMGEIIGKIPINATFEDSKGLWISGEVNLQVQRGREVYELALQKALNAFSIGFISQSDRMEDGIRIIDKARIIEGSIVPMGMNRNAKIASVKALCGDMDNLTKRQLEKALRETGFFSKKDSKIIASKFNDGQTEHKTATVTLTPDGSLIIGGAFKLIGFSGLDEDLVVAGLDEEDEEKINDEDIETPVLSLVQSIKNLHKETEEKIQKQKLMQSIKSVAKKNKNI